MRLDEMSLKAAIRLMLSEEAMVASKLLARREELASAIEEIARAFRQGGRLLYVGAGTSGRIGALDASECPPTFGTPPESVQIILAGGRSALWRSVEGAEDDFEQGAREIASRSVSAKDVLVGIAASGTTPFVWGALGEAKRRRATTVLLCFNPYVRIPRALRPSLTLSVDLGPEVLTGSTRLKAGTATKLVLNLFTTLSMVRLGKVMSNLMVDVNPANTKLRQRAIRIVCDLTGARKAAATKALDKNGWSVRKTVKELAAIK